MSVLELVQVQCMACGDEFETARCNLGYGCVYCDECNDGFEIEIELRRNGEES